MDKKVFVKLNSDQYQNFEKIKKFLGLTSDAEVVRYLIAEFYNSKLKEVEVSE